MPRLKQTPSHTSTLLVPVVVTCCARSERKIETEKETETEKVRKT